MCLVEFRLDKAYPMNVEFDWKTNDSLYLQTPPAGSNYIYGKPGYHYTSTHGHITFAAGQTTSDNYVQNINPDNVAIQIGVIMSNCKYDVGFYNCTDFFRP